MTLLLSTGSFALRRPIAAGPLGTLAESLRADLEVARQHELHFPTEKALLSREGGRCARDGAYLDFDPFERHEHRCPQCGAVYRGELHDRFWIYWYQLWLAERAVHGAVLSALGIDNSFAVFSSDILRGYADRYLQYPNADNVLGPSRLFFSTYLESIWLLQICIATELLAAKDPALSQLVIDRIVEPARAMIAEFDEGASNRQVWNDVALFASAQLVGDAASAERAILGGSGIVPSELVSRFQRGFATPFATALPDFTLPSRRDSQYAISLRQWRIAEHCELGFARVEDPILLGALTRMYESDERRGDTARSRSSADVERNAQSSALSRADLSWRALLFARAELPAGGDVAPGSALLEAQGIGVFRRDAGRIYAALDYGHSGGGHGHPDRLNLLLADGTTRWLDDMGTGSYVDPSLHWYRSTLAHNAPMVNGRSQQRVNGDLLAFEESGEAGWICAAAEDVAPGVGVMRTVAIMPTYVVDIVEWDSESDVTFDLPLHADLSIERGAGSPRAARFVGGVHPEDGFSFVRDPERQLVDEGSVIVATASAESRRARLFAHATVPTEWWRATAPGAPGKGDHTFRVVRSRARSGRYVCVWSVRGDIESVDFGDTLRVTMADGSTHEHQRTGDGWRADISVAGSTRRVILGGMTQRAVPTGAGEETDETFEIRAFNLPITVQLGESHYRRSEQAWRDAGEPTATVELALHDGSLHIEIDVHHSDLAFVPAGATNPFDNEPADINGDGVQLYLRTPLGSSGWMLVPETGSDAVRVRGIEGWDTAQSIDASWKPTAHGYTVNAMLPIPDPMVAVDVIVNEMPRGRVRRRGQLVMSGAGGEFIYLRGDRHDPQRLIFLLQPDA
jgi:hypothetical protein